MDSLNPATQSIADWGRKLIEDLEKTKNVLQGIVEKGEELDYFTEAMRKQIQIQTEVRKLAISLNMNGE